MKIEWSPLSIKRANEIAEYIALDSLEESNKWRQDLINRVEQLKKFSTSGRVVPELNDILKRELIFGNYRIIYRISENKIFILTLRHIRQRLADDYISSK
jgi:plasmid stabilization system protein ParE